MNIAPGTSTTFLVTSISGRAVATFEKRTDLDNWIKAREGNGVNYRIFEQRTSTIELGAHRARPLRIVQG